MATLHQYIMLMLLAQVLILIGSCHNHLFHHMYRSFQTAVQTRSYVNKADTSIIQMIQAKIGHNQTHH